jgi:hypothetical protein
MKIPMLDSLLLFGVAFFLSVLSQKGPLAWQIYIYIYILFWDVHFYSRVNLVSWINFSFNLEKI